MVLTKFSLYQIHMPVKGTVQKTARYETMHIRFLVNGIWGGELDEM